MSGEASFILTQCSYKEFYNFGTAYVLAVLNIQLENYHGDVTTEAKAEARAIAKRQMANVARNAYAVGAHAVTAVTRTEVNGIELDWEDISKWSEEQQQAIMFDAFAFSADKELYVLNAEASKNLGEEAAEQPDNDYEWGLKADAVADWLNRQGKDDAETRSGLSDFRHAVTRAEGSTAINDLMDAQTKEFVFDYLFPYPYKNRVYIFPAAIKVQYTVYSAYNFGDNVEYYQVRQNITVMNDKIFFNHGNDAQWISRADDGDWVNARGDWMKSIDTKMWLEGSGTKSILSASPLNENGSSSGSSTTGGATATTEGWSVSKGLSAGISFGYMTLAGNISFNIARTTDHSTTNEISWNTTTNWSTMDLTTTFTQDNDANGTVTWKHLGNTPKTGDDAVKSKQKPLLTGTCVTDEQALWKIDNPSGTYTLKANLNVTSEMIKAHKKTSYVHFVTQTNPHDISFELNAPNRFKAQWNNVIYDYGSVTGDIQLTHYLDEYIEKAYGYNSAVFCWAGLFVSTEATADGSDNARAVFQTFKNSITGMKVQLYQKGFRGQLVFGLKRDGVSALTDKIVLDMDKFYQVGETLTEEVNGYELTFKVTKKNEEVELCNVPNEFTGRLEIPERVGDIRLKVTSLGLRCALSCNGITAVTIPSTMKVIGSGAFYDCKNIKEVHVMATTLPSVVRLSLYPIYEYATLYVPTGYKDIYANADYWKEFKNIVEE